MKRDIPNFKVTDVGIAVVPREGATDEEELWDTYLVNMKDHLLQSVLINSKGYGDVDGEKVKTSILRHFFDQIEPNSCTPIEPIQTKLFGLTNEYWISFSLPEDSYMYDKKYVFVKGSITESNFTTIPYLNKKGVMIK
ncbi:MAG: hypothetical protein AAF798_13940 [Bacteroidota bacterium]